MWSCACSRACVDMCPGGPTGSDRSDGVRLHALGVIGMFGGGVVNAPRRAGGHSKGTRHESRASRACVLGRLEFDFDFGPGLNTPKAVWHIRRPLVLADLTVLNTAWGPTVCGAAYPGVARDSRRRGLGGEFVHRLGACLRVLDALRGLRSHQGCGGRRNGSGGQGRLVNYLWLSAAYQPDTSRHASDMRKPGSRRS